MGPILNIHKQFQTLMSSLSDGDQEFDLDQDLIQELLLEFNVKVNPASSGFICFKDSDIGGAAYAKSSGRALCNFLRSKNISSRSSIEELFSILKV